MDLASIALGALILCAGIGALGRKLFRSSSPRWFLGFACGQPYTIQCECATLGRIFSFTEYYHSKQAPITLPATTCGTSMCSSRYKHECTRRDTLIAPSMSLANLFAYYTRNPGVTTRALISSTDPLSCFVSCFFVTGGGRLCDTHRGRSSPPVLAGCAPSAP